jgi:predicted RNA methylase
MVWIPLVLLLILAPFLLVVFVGAPYVPMHRKNLNSVFSSIKLPKHALVIDLGSGDGRLLLLAAQKGYTAIGYELNPFLVLTSRYKLRKYPNARVYMKDFWQADVTEADLVFTFLATNFMSKLQKNIVSKMKKGSYFASYAFEIPDIELLHKKNSVNMYKL